MSLQLTVDVKELYAQLCPECQVKMVDLVAIQPDKVAIRKALEGS